MIYRIVPGLLDLDEGTVPGFTFEEIEPGPYRRVARAFDLDEVFTPAGSYCSVLETREG